MTHKFQHYRPINQLWPPLWSFTLLQRGINQKIDLVKTLDWRVLLTYDQRVRTSNRILQDIFRDTPHDHIWRALICAKNAYLGAYLSAPIWLSGVSLKRSFKMFRHVGLRSIGPFSPKLWPNQFFGQSPLCYNVILQCGGHSQFMGL